RAKVGHVGEAVNAFRPHVVALAPRAPGALDDPGWQDTEELSLPHTVVPWARRAGVPVVAVGLAEGERDDPGAPGAAAQLRRYLELYEDGQRRLREVDRAWEPVRALLAQPLDRRRVLGGPRPAAGGAAALARD